jgi:hypothetical protein
MKRLRLDGASSRRRSRNASGPQSTSRITPGTARVEIDRQGLELLRNQSKSRLCRLFAGVSAGSDSAGSKPETLADPVSPGVIGAGRLRLAIVLYVRTRPAHSDGLPWSGSTRSVSVHRGAPFSSAPSLRSIR